MERGHHLGGTISINSALPLLRWAGFGGRPQSAPRPEATVSIRCTPRFNSKIKCRVDFIDLRLICVVQSQKTPCFRSDPVLQGRIEPRKLGRKRTRASTAEHPTVSAVGSQSPHQTAALLLYTYTPSCSIDARADRSIARPDWSDDVGPGRSVACIRRIRMCVAHLTDERRRRSSFTPPKRRMPWGRLIRRTLCGLG